MVCGIARYQALPGNADRRGYASFEEGNLQERGL